MNYEELFERVWERGQYRLGSASQRLVPWICENVPAGSAINDYGSGTGRSSVELVRMGYKVNMVDFVDTALEDEARSMIDGDRLTYTISDLAALPETFPKADWGVCIGVLMLVDPEALQSVLGHIRRTSMNLLVAVYDRPDVRLGTDLTTVRGSPEWWQEKLSSFWGSVEVVPGREPSNKRLHICRP